MSTYNAFAYGPVLQESADNPGNSDPVVSPPQTEVIPNTDPNSALLACGEYTDGLGYSSFDLSFLTSTCAYTCVAYLGPQTSGAPFSVANPDVVFGYGYSV